MYLDVYISWLDNYDWDGGDWNIGNAPGRWSPFFPPTCNGKSPFSEVKKRLEEGKYKGQQVDWGCWVVVATKKEILEFIADMYGERGKDFLARYSEEFYSYMRKQMCGLLDFVDNKLEDGKEYALVASEL